MSAVAPTQEKTKATSMPQVVAHEQLSTAEIQEKEAYRWMLWFGLPMLAATFFVATALGTNSLWPIGGAVFFLIVAIGTLIWLCLSTCTNKTTPGH